MTWIFEVSVEGAIFEPKKIKFFLGTDKLLMIEIKSKRAYIMLVLDIRWRNEKGSIFLDIIFFWLLLLLLEKILTV